MRILFFAILLLPFLGETQNVPLEFRIDSITSADTTTERKFTIHYHLSNLTNDKLSFFLKPDGIIPNTGGSMSNFPYYKIYEGDKFLNLGTAFNRPDRNDPNPQRVRYDYADPQRNEDNIKSLRENFVVTDAMVDELRKTGKISTTEELSDSLMVEVEKGNHRPKAGLQFRERKVIEDLFILQPKETRSFTKTLYWNKDRYFFHDPEEFYLSDTAKHYLELTIVLLKEAFKDKLTEEEYTAIMADEHFIKGVYFSNKAEINFN
jgi:hypothetical protein